MRLATNLYVVSGSSGSCMLDKHERGEKIGTVRQTLGRVSNEDNPTSGFINLSNIDVECGERYVFELKAVGSGLDLDEDVVFDRKTHSGQKTITLPKEVVESQGLLPGHTIGVNVFELEEKDTSNQEGLKENQNSEEDNGDQSHVVDRTEVWADKTSPDGIDSRIHSESIYNAINGDSVVEFKNLRNGKSTKATTKPLNNNGELSFRKNTRSEIAVEPGDVIELRLGIKSSDGNNNNQDNHEMLEEIHEMLTELYQAYKND